MVNLPPDQSGRLPLHESEQILRLADRLGIRGGTNPLPAGPVNQAWNARAEASSTWGDGQEFAATAAFDTTLDTRWASNEATPTLTFAPAEADTFEFDRIALHEFRDSREGGDGFSRISTPRIKSYRIEAEIDGEWRAIHLGEQIGGVEIIRFPTVISATALRLAVTESTQPPAITHIAVGRQDSIQPR